jgi:uncharacterized protein (TIGR03435 family)
MKRREITEALDRTLGLFRNPPPELTESVQQRVLRGLSSEPHEAFQEVPSSLIRRTARPQWIAITSIAAVIILAISLSTLTLRSAPAVLEDATGTHKIQYGEIVRPSGQASAMLTVADGSHVEMRSQSELSLEEDDGLRIRLGKGGVIVNAAKQAPGRHLYIQTKDVSVAVVGTVFLVNAEEEGSRVAVIEGVVRVQQDGTEKKLAAGEQAATNPAMPAVPVAEEISWSRNAPAHLALLQRAEVTPPQTPAPATSRLEFAAVSIKPNVRNGPRGGYQFLAGGANGPSWGFACHGTDGIQRAAFGTGPDLSVAQGRCVGNGVSVARLTTYAYGIPWRDGAAVPDWARYDSSPVSQEWFQVDAVAENPSTATTAELRLMLQTMLEVRFKLKVHREPQQVEGYALRVARNGPKLREAQGDEQPPTMQLVNGEPGIKGRSSLDKLVWFLTQLINGDPIEFPFVDRTGLTGIYEYEFPLSNSGGGGVRGASPSLGPPVQKSRSERLMDAAAALSGAMEDRLGLRLQGEKVPIDYLVVDHLENPTEN